MTDFRVVENGDGGDLEISGGDIKPDNTFYTSIYLSLFSGESFSNVYSDRPTNNEFEKALNQVINDENLKAIEKEALDALDWMKEDGLIDELSCNAYQSGVNRVTVEITTTQPGDVKDEFSFVWDAQRKELI